MATTSLLQQKMTEEAINNPSAPWTTTECAVELLVKAMGQVVVPPPTPVTVEPQITVVSTSGSVAAGAMALWFELSANFTGTILGQAYDGSVTTMVNIPVPANAKLTAVPYTVTTGTLTIFSAYEAA